MNTDMKRKAPKVGKCEWCGHWGLVWGRFCRHPWKKAAGMCRVYFNRWVHSENRVIRPLKDTGDWKTFLPQSPWGQPADCGRMRKVHRVQGWREF